MEIGLGHYQGENVRGASVPLTSLSMTLEKHHPLCSLQNYNAAFYHSSTVKNGSNRINAVAKK